VTQFFVQEGRRINSPAPTLDDLSKQGGLSPEACLSLPKVFDERDYFSERGGYSQHNEALKRPMVLSMSLLANVSGDELL
jgi:cellulose 1,4-beta-cellobiosidase